MPETHCRVVLAGPLEGQPQPDDFELRREPVPAPGDGEVLVRHIYLSLDPYQRPAMAGRHASGRVALGAGDMPQGETIGQIMASRAPGWRPGEYVRHFGGWQEYSIARGADLHRLDPDAAPLSAWLGVLGMPGLTAWASIIKLAGVRAGQTVLVSAAAGPVGATLGQIAINLGARAVGIAGSREKCKYVTEELGFDACINYKQADYPDSLRAALPDGADIYHDNVGGQMLADALGVLKTYGTVILCGLMSSYNDPGNRQDLYIGLPILKRAVLKGLVVYDFEDQRDEFVSLVAPWVSAGRVRFREDRAHGIAATGAQFCRLMRGDNFGKTLVVLGAEA